MAELNTWIRSFALVRKFSGKKQQWLARHVSRAGHQLEFIGAPRLERESFRETIQREVAWILELDAKRDFLVSNMAQLNLEFVDRFPGDDRDSHVAVSFFVVNIYRRQALELIESNQANRWLTSEEVCKGQTASGEVLDARLKFVLDRAKVINSWD